MSETLPNHNRADGTWCPLSGCTSQSGTCPACPQSTPPESFRYESWRHGGWYVHEVHYPSGAIGCVSRNFADKQWRIVCDPRPFATAPTFKNRDEAARAEWHLAQSLRIVGTDCTCSIAHTGTGWDLTIVSPCFKHNGAEACLMVGIAVRA